jgi:NAD(P)-dependent dehydrogenase (short-subunit alcohol dehydrogenase family)
MAFRGKVALVTGAASGMGRLASRRLAAAGAQVAAIDVNEEGLRETADGSDAIRAYPLDVTDLRAVAELVRRVESELGPVDRVMNAAAIMPTGLLMDQDVPTVRRIMDINYGGSVAITRAVLPGMLERGRGDVVNFASIAGWSPTLHFGAYNASKFAVVAYTEVLYHENRGKGVRICCVCPPPVETPLLEQAKSKPKMLERMGKPIEPEQVLDAIERGLEKGALFVFPGRGTRFGQLMRRFAPGLVWRMVHRVEGF